MHLPIKGDIVAGFQDQIVSVTSWLRSHVTPAPYAELMPRLCNHYGQLYGIRGDVMLCQMILETNWFKFGGDVRPSQNNFGGIGATGGGVAGESFASCCEGTEAHAQILAIRTGSPIPRTKLLSQRYRELYDFVFGKQPNWEDLAGTWAADPDYWNKIQTIARSLAKATGVDILTGTPTPTPAPTPTPIDLPLQGKRIALNPGHTLDRPGARGQSPDFPQEEILNRIQTDYVKRELEAAGATVSLIESASLSAIGRQAQGHDLFISLHHNAANADDVDEYTCSLCLPSAPKATLQLASDIAIEIAEAIGNRIFDARGKYPGVMKRNIGVLRYASATNCPINLLVESYFVDAYGDFEVCKKRSLKAAKAIVAQLKTWA